MERLQKQKFKWNYLAVAFGIPVVCMLVYMLCAQCAPFGKYSMLYSDMYHQYYPFFKAFRAQLLSGDSMLYTWSVGMGMDYLGLISYYLASPLNLLSIFVPEGLLLDFFSLLMPVKLGLASLFFAMFLKGVFQKNDISIAVFGAFYGLCAWALGYQWNIMWLDTFALLPLVMLGMVSLLRKRKFILYTLTLFLSIYANYYIGFFVCIFVLLVFICYQICRCSSFTRLIVDLALIAVCSLLAIGMTAILELPALAALQTTQSSVNNFPETFRLNIVSEHNWKGLLDAMRQVAGNMGGGISPTFKEGLPNVYCGLGSIFFAVLFLMTRDVRLRDKFCAVALLVFFNMSFVIRQLDYIWHGFHFTNMIPYRFSFLYSFVMLYMAYRAWLSRNKFRSWQILLAGAMTLLLLICSKDREDAAFLAYNLGFLAVYLAFMLAGRMSRRLPQDATPEQIAETRVFYNRKRYVVRLLLLSFMGIELVLTMVNFGVNFTKTNASNYPKGTSYSKSVIAYMHEREEDTLFYRAETTHSQTLNDGALNGYMGVSTFTSSANVKVTEFMKALGYGAKNTYNRYCFEEASPVSDLFLGLKYMIERDGKDRQSEYFTERNHYGNTILLENNAYLPLGFLVNQELEDVAFDSGIGVFLLQNQIFSAATGVEGDVWHRLLGDCLTITGTDVTVSDHTPSGYCSYKDSNGGQIVYTYLVDQDGFMCVDLNLPKRNGVSIWHNGVELYSETMSLQQTLAVGDVSVGDTVQVRMSCKDGESGTTTLSAAILNSSRFWQGYEILNASTLELTKFTNTLVEGTVECDREGLLYTSIPQNGNWTVLVDGEEAEIHLIGDAMISVPLTEGTHTLTYRYENPAFSLGWKVSLVSFLLFGLLTVLVYRPDLTKKTGKYEK